MTLFRVPGRRQISRVGVFRADLQGNLLHVNDPWCEITGRSRAEARGRGSRTSSQLERTPEGVPACRYFTSIVAFAPGCSLMWTPKLPGFSKVCDQLWSLASGGLENEPSSAALASRRTLEQDWALTHQGSSGQPIPSRSRRSPATPCTE